LFPYANAVPDEWCRIKKEPDKTRINKELPDANWYSIETAQHVAIKSEDSSWNL
jgi:hypothetical protein